jgi:hypothetical protein
MARFKLNPELLSAAELDSRVARLFLTQNTITGKNIPNGRKIFQMTLKYTNIFYSKALQNLPKLGFWFENIGTIWQPTSTREKINSRPQLVKPLFTFIIWHHSLLTF